MAPRKRNSENHVTEYVYTDRALRLAAKRIPKIVYLPAALRGHNQFATIDNIQVRITGPQITDNHLRIQEADPLGHMIATMQGLPIPQFHVEDHVHSADCPADCQSTDPVIRISYYTPTPGEQREAAKWLATRVTFKAPNAYNRYDLTKRSGMATHAEDYDAMIQNRAAQGDHHTDTNTGE